MKGRRTRSAAAGRSAALAPQDLARHGKWPISRFRKRENWTRPHTDTCSRRRSSPREAVRHVGCPRGLAGALCEGGDAASSPPLSPLGPPAEPAEHHPCRDNRLAADSQDHGGYRNAGQSPTPNRHLRRKRPVLTSPSPVNAVDDDRDWSSGTVGGALSDDQPHRGNAASVSALTIIRWGFTWFSRGIIPQYWHRQVLL